MVGALETALGRAFLELSAVTCCFLQVSDRVAASRMLSIRPVHHASTTRVP